MDMKIKLTNHWVTFKSADIFNAFCIYIYFQEEKEKTEV